MLALCASKFDRGKGGEREKESGREEERERERNVVPRGSSEKSCRA